uniref:deoxyribose-phosphate aldolase n=1 Tax=Diplonema papillatum TaxID=91374 RepID=A0A0B6VU04_9EUGL|nr:deoxyribose-phosphate aldolase [Diplonema papillatum]
MMSGAHRVVLAAVMHPKPTEEEDIYNVLPHVKKGDKRQRVTPKAVASYIDHTVLKPDATAKDVVKLCKEAAEHKFYAVCVNSSRVKQCADELRGTDVKIASVVGFPLGAMLTKAKAFETTEACADGATEIDMVLNIGQLLDGNYSAVLADIKAVVEAAAQKKATVKVIFETCLLTDEQIIDASILSAVAGARFVKTSTGFSKGGATPAAVDIMKTVVGDACLVKASGGVRDLETAIRYIEAGTDRIGTSSGIAIVKGGTAKGY